MHLNLKKKVKGFDYNKEVPYQMKAPVGFYDTTEEQENPDEKVRGGLLHKLEGKRRYDDDEKTQKEDQKKKMRGKMKKDLPAVIAQINKLTDPEQIRKKTKLLMPAPQISDVELEEFSKMNTEPQFEQSDEHKVTDTLLSKYSVTPAHTPFSGRTPANFGMRTPARTPLRPDTLLQEAKNLIALTNTETPLAGGENTPLYPSDYSKATPTRKVVQTPNILATPRTQSGNSTPSRNNSGQKTPLRDSLGLNDEIGLTPEATAREERQKQAALREQVKTGLFKLPAPKHEYKILAPELPPDSADDVEIIEEDAIDIAAKKEAQRNKEHNIKMRERSEVLRRNLVRPIKVNPTLSPIPVSDADLHKQAEYLIQLELYNLLINDALQYPVNNQEKQNLSLTMAFERVTEAEMDKAKQLVEEELKEIEPRQYSYEEYSNAWAQCYEDLIYSSFEKKNMLKNQV